MWRHQMVGLWDTLKINQSLYDNCDTVHCDAYAPSTKSNNFIQIISNVTEWYLWWHISANNFVR